MNVKGITSVFAIPFTMSIHTLQCIIILCISVVFTTVSATDVTVGFEQLPEKPMLMHAFNARNDAEVMFLYKLRSGLGTRRPDDPDGTRRMLDTLRWVYTGYDTTGAGKTLAQKDGICLQGMLNKRGSQMFILDSEAFRQLLYYQHGLEIDSVDSVFLHWKGSILNRGKNRIYATFHLAHTSHLFFVAKGDVDSLSMDTTVTIVGTTNWFRTYAFCRLETGISIEFTATDTEAIDIRTDFLALTFRFNAPSTSQSHLHEAHNSSHDAIIFHRRAGRGGLIEICTVEDVKITILLYSLQGKAVRKQEVLKKAGTSYWSDWDGCDHTGVPVAPGTYLLSVKNKRGSTTGTLINVY